MVLLSAQETAGIVSYLGSIWNDIMNKSHFQFRQGAWLIICPHPPLSPMDQGETNTCNRIFAIGFTPLVFWVWGWMHCDHTGWSLIAGGFNYCQSYSSLIFAEYLKPNQSYSDIICSPLICQFLFLRATPSQLTQKYLIRNGSTRCSMWCWLCFYPSHLIPALIRPEWTISSNTIYSLNGVAIRCLSSKIPVLIQPR